MRFSWTCALPAALLVSAGTALAAPGTNSAYLTDLQTSRVEDATSRGIGEVNMIACIMSAMRPDALVNEPNYIALIDKNKCDSEKRSSNANASASDGAQAAASYITATVNASRASNSAPMITKAWLDLDEDGAHVQISVHISATEAPSSTNPYGAFRLDYCGQLDGTGPCLMRGYLQAGNGGIDFFDLSNDEGEETVAMKLAVNGAGGSGSGKLEMLGGGGGDATFAFAYDTGLFHRDIDGSEQCFSRDARDPDTGLSVWRYGLYDAETGERVTRNSGFPIEYTNGGTTYHGYLGYYGLSLPPEAANQLENGATVTKVDYSSGNNPTRTDYTVAKSGGKLIKYTKRTSTLAQLDQIRFNTFVGMEANDFFSGATPNTQYELYWNEATLDFVVSAQMQCGQNGCQTSAVPGDHHVQASFWSSRGGVQGWSQSLGGEVFIDFHTVNGAVDSALVPVVYRTQDMVYPEDLPASLYCLNNCPTQASLQAYFTSNSNDPSSSPYVGSTFNNWNSTPAGSVVHYGTSASAIALRGGDLTNDDVVYTDAEAYHQHPQYMHGVMSGRLFTTLSDALCDATAGASAGYCDWKVNNTEVYYQWQTGPNSWNQFAAVKDSGGTFVAFDAPLQLSFHVPDEAAYGEYRNTNMVLQYGGFGDLWGIPGTCVSWLTNEPVSCDTQNSRYVPAFVIPYSQTQGVVTSTGSDHTNYLVKWLEREIRFASKNLADCSSLPLPVNVQLPTEQVLKSPADSSSDIYIGTKPTVTDAPRVIHGEVKY